MARHGRVVWPPPFWLRLVETQSRVPYRCGHKVNPARVVTDWSKDENTTLIEKHAELDGKMAQIQRWLPGRSYNDCQKRFWVLIGSGGVKTME